MICSPFLRDFFIYCKKNCSYHPLKWAGLSDDRCRIYKAFQTKTRVSPFSHLIWKNHGSIFISTSKIKIKSSLIFTQNEFSHHKNVKAKMTINHTKSIIIAKSSYWKFIWKSYKNLPWLKISESVESYIEGKYLNFHLKPSNVVSK